MLISTIISIVSQIIPSEYAKCNETGSVFMLLSYFLTLCVLILLINDASLDFRYSFRPRRLARTRIADGSIFQEPSGWQVRTTKMNLPVELWAIIVSAVPSCDTYQDMCDGLHCLHPWMRASDVFVNSYEMSLHVDTNRLQWTSTTNAHGDSRYTRLLDR